MTGHGLIALTIILVFVYGMLKLLLDYAKDI